MGPRHRRRGWSSRATATTTPSPSFNGAASSKTRMGAEARGAPEGAPGFNGAASSKTRMGAGSWRPTTPAIASFNGAASSKTRMACIAGREHKREHASMGPRHRRRGWRLRLPSALRSWLASMGPRHRRRGWRATGSEAGPSLPASMGPRHRRRGWGCNSGAVGARSTGLQWGRVIEDADGRAVDPRHRELSRASMGPRHRRRGWRSSTPHRPPQKRGFNGAASSKTRMAVRWIDMSNQAVELQWGRVIEDADGGVQQPGLGPHHGSASMGPRHRRRGWSLRLICILSE